jgi:hypothetical protein
MHRSKRGYSRRFGKIDVNSRTAHEPGKCVSATAAELWLSRHHPPIGA